MGDRDHTGAADVDLELVALRSPCSLIKGRLRDGRPGPQRKHHPHQRHPLQRPATASRENRSCPHVAISLVNPSVCRQQRGETVSSAPCLPPVLSTSAPHLFRPRPPASRPELGADWVTATTAPPQGVCGQELAAICRLLTRSLAVCRGPARQRGPGAAGGQESAVGDERERALEQVARSVREEQPGAAATGTGFPPRAGSRGGGRGAVARVPVGRSG